MHEGQSKNKAGFESRPFGDKSSSAHMLLLSGKHTNNGGVSLRVSSAPSLFSLHHSHTDFVDPRDQMEKHRFPTGLFHEEQTGLRKLTTNNHDVLLTAKEQEVVLLQ